MDCDLAVMWFAGGHAAATVLLAKLLGKKSIIVVGGFDVACIPEINYGRFTQSWTRRLLTRLALHHADRVLVVDPSLKVSMAKQKSPIMAMKFPQVYLRLFHFAAPAE